MELPQGKRVLEQIQGSSTPTHRSIVLSLALFSILGAVIAVIPLSIVLGLTMLLIIGASFWTLQRTLFSIYILIATSILLAYRLPSSVVNITPYRAAIVLACFYVIANMLAQRRERILERHFHRILALALFALPLCLVYFLNAVRSLPEPQAQFKLLSFGVAVTTLIVFTYFMHDAKRFVLAMNTQIASALLLSLYGLYEVIAQVVTGRRPNLPFAQFGFETVIDKRFGSFETTLDLLRAESFLNDSNILAIYLSSAILFCLVFLFEEKVNRNRLYYWLSLLLISICIVFTLSRSAMIGLGVGVSFVLLKYIRARRQFSYKLIVLVVLVLIVVLALLYVGIPAFQDYVHGLALRFSSLNFESRRLMLMTGGLTIFGENLLLGAGVGTLESHGLGSHTAHSSYLTLLAETGIVGGLCLLLFLMPIFIATWTIIRDENARMMELGIVAGTLSLLIFEIFYDTLFVSPTTMIIFAFGYSHALWKIARGRFRTNIL